MARTGVEGRRTGKQGGLINMWLLINEKRQGHSIAVPLQATCISRLERTAM